MERCLSSASELNNYALTYLWIFTNLELLPLSSMSWMFHNHSKGNEMHHESSSGPALVMWLTPIWLDVGAYRYWICIFLLQRRLLTLLTSHQSPLCAPVSCWTGVRGRRRDTEVSVCLIWPRPGRVAWRCVRSSTDTDQTSCKCCMPHADPKKCPVLLWFYI